MSMDAQSSSSLVMESIESSTHEIAIEMSTFEESVNPEIPMTRSFRVIAIRRLREESPERTSESATERPQCRICLEQEVEGQTDPILSLGCKCIGELGQAHKSCIEAWFGRQVNRGRVTCEICNSVLRMSVLLIAVASSIQLNIHESASALDLNLNNTEENIVRVQSRRRPTFHLHPAFLPQATLSEGNINDSDESGQLGRTLRWFQVLTVVLVTAVLYIISLRLLGGN